MSIEDVSTGVHEKKKYLRSKDIAKQGKSKGFDSCDRPSNLTQIGFKSSIFQSGNS